MKVVPVSAEANEAASVPTIIATELESDSESAQKTASKGMLPRRWLEQPLFGGQAKRVAPDADAQAEPVLAPLNKTVSSEPSPPTPVSAFDVGPAHVRTYCGVQLAMDYFQLHGLMWLLFRQWKAPEFWLRLSGFAAVFNVDVKGPVAVLFGFEAPGVAYVLTWGAVVTVVVAAAWRSPRPYELLRLREFLIVPLCLCAWAAFEDPSVGLKVMSLALLLLAVANGGALQRRLRGIVVSFNAADHDAVVAQREVEWLLRLNEEWFVDHLRLVTPFRLQGAFHRLDILAQKLFMTAVACVGASLPPSPSLAAWQSVVLSAGSFCFAVYFTVLPPFRWRRLNHMLIFLEWTLFGNCYVGSLFACEVKSALTTSANATPALIALNALPALAAVLLECRARLRCKHGRNCVGSEQLAFELVQDADARRWVLAIHATRKIVAVHQCTAPALFPVHLFLRRAIVLAACAKEAKARAVAVTVDVGVGVGAGGGAGARALLGCLQETLDIAHAVIGSNKDASMYPNTSLELYMPGLAASSRRQDRELVLVHPSKRRILRKLHAMSLFHAARFELPQAEIQAEMPKLIERVDDALSNANLDVLERLRHQLVDGQAHPDVIARIDEALRRQLA